jgi:transcriptional regulator with XRE-family HTH domain
MSDNNTNELLQMLFKETSLNRALHAYDTQLLPTCGQYLTALCEQRGITAESIIKKADIHRTYGHQIFNDTRQPSRDKVLQLAFGFEMDYEQAQKLLAIARKSALHPKVKRDAAVIFALKKQMKLAEFQAMLHKMGIPILGEGARR